MGYREATYDEKHRFSLAVLAVRSMGEVSTEIDRKHKRIIRRLSLEGESNIGGLAEKTMHLSFKYFFEPDKTFHEVKLGRHYADIMRDGQIYEIQTHNFCSFRKKLAAVSEKHPVTVVHPLCTSTKIYTINPETGETSSGRTSPVHEDIYSAFLELVYIRELIHRENLSFIFPVVKCDEYRVKYGEKRRYNKGWLKYDSVPTELCGFYEFDTAFAFASLLPYTDKPLTVKEICALIGKERRTTSAFVNVLMYLDILKKDGYEERSVKYIYGENY